MRLTRFANLFSVATLAMGLVASTVNAAFIIEPRAGGKATANFSTVGDTGAPSNSSTTGTAVGLTSGIGSIQGGASATADAYAWKYTPGTDADNTPLVAGGALGGGNLATGLSGGASGIYNVYATFPASATASTGNPSTYAITHEAGVTQLVLNQNTPTTQGNVWFLVGQATLNAGTTYTLTQTASNSTFVSQRASGAMFEYIGPVVPEPATFVLAGASLLGLAGLPRRRKAWLVLQE